MAVLGVGCDILYLPRIRNIMSRDTTLARLSHISEKIMHPVELQRYRDLCKLRDREKIALYFGSIWCIKESLYKSMSFEEQQKMSFFKMSKLYYKSNDLKKKNRPVLVSENGDSKITFHISLSHDTEYIASYVVRESRDQ